MPNRASPHKVVRCHTVSGGRLLAANDDRPVDPGDDAPDPWGMHVPTLRAVAISFLLTVAGACALAVAVAPGSPAQPDPGYLAAADGSVLEARATPQPSASDHSLRDEALHAWGTRMSADGVAVVEIPAAPGAPAKKTTRPASPSAPALTAALHYEGVNHVWIPALGINRSVAWFPCNRVAPPDNFMYRWGCAGRNNVYLMGHAYAPMKPLHDAYARGALRVGMRAIYADGAGRVHTYAVIWWKVTRPTTDAAWAWAAQKVPSMTLQTCVGAHSEYRLMVRLQEVAN